MPDTNIADDLASLGVLPSKPLLVAAQSGPIYGGASAPFRVAHSALLPANTIVGGCLIRIKAIVSKYLPVNGGHNWRVRLVQGANSVVVLQNSIGASLATYYLDHAFWISADRRWGFAYSLNGNDTASIVAGTLADTGAKTGGVATLNANQASTQIAFASYSAAPIQETILIDFAQPSTLSIDVQAINGDTVEISGVSVEMIASSASANYANPIATWAIGDSLTQGSGATAVSGVPMDYPAQLRRTRAGRPLVNGGLGGQVSSQIVDRIVADPIRGKLWDMVLFTGANDASADGPTWWAVVRTQIDRALAFRSSTARTIICNLFPRSDWANGTAFNTALRYLNTQLLTRYGTMVCDLYTPLATNADGTVPAALMVGGGDTIHLNNAGYTIVANTVDAKMTALGWV